jgi:hypothetical protein
MSNSFLISLGEQDSPAAGLRSRIFEGIILIEEECPISVFAWLARLMDDGGVLDSSLARWSGAVVALRDSSAAALATRESFRSRYRKSVEAVVRAAGLNDVVADWLASDGVGASSMAILNHVGGVDSSECGPLRLDHSSSPSDVSDFRRCRLLLECDPALVERFGGMSVISAAWAALVQRWPELCSSLDAECPTWRDSLGQCPKTESLLREVLSSSSAA